MLCVPDKTQQGCKTVVCVCVCACACACVCRVVHRLLLQAVGSNSVKLHYLLSLIHLCCVSRICCVTFPFPTSEYCSDT